MLLLQGSIYFAKAIYDEMGIW